MARRKGIDLGQAGGLLAITGIIYLLITNKKAIGQKFRETLGGSSSENSGIPSLDDGSANINRNNGDDSSLPNEDLRIPPRTTGYGPYGHGDFPPQAPPTYYNIPLPPPPAPPQSSSLKFYGRQDLQFYQDLGYSAQTARQYSKLPDTYNRELTSPTSSIYKFPQYGGGTGFGNTATVRPATAEDTRKASSNFGTGRTGGTGYQGQGTGSVLTFLRKKPKPTPQQPSDRPTQNNRFQNLRPSIPTGSASNQQQVDNSRADRYTQSTGRPQPVQSAAANKILNAYNAYRRGNR